MPDVSRTTNKRPAFTLVEALIVISIISILAVVTLSAFNPGLFLAESRDTQRKEDIQAIATALQLYYTEIGNYPQEYECDTSRGSDNDPDCSSINPLWPGWITYLVLPLNGILYKLVTEEQILKNLPIDPKNNSTYYYRYEPSQNEDQSNACTINSAVTCHIFWIGARLESTDDGKEGKMVYRCTNDTSTEYKTGCQEVEFLKATSPTVSFDSETFVGVTKR